jgi:hypothetical protein
MNDQVSVWHASPKLHEELCIHHQTKESSCKIGAIDLFPVKSIVFQIGPKMPAGARILTCTARGWKHLNNSIVYKG